MDSVAKGWVFFYFIEIYGLMLCSLFWVLFKSIVVIYHEKEKGGML